MSGGTSLGGDTVHYDTPQNDFRDFLANLTQNYEGGFNAWLGALSQNANANLTRFTAFCQPECGDQLRPWLLPPDNRWQLRPLNGY